MIVKELIARWGFEVDKSGVAAFDRTIGRMKTTAKAVGASIIGLGVLATKTAMDFNKSFKAVLAELDLTRVSADEAQRAVMQLSKEFGDMPADVQAGMVAALANGFRDLAAATAVTRAGMELATSAATEIGPTVEGLAKILRVYRLNAGEAGKVSEVLFAGKGIAGGNLAALMALVAKLAPQARAAGIGLHELVATMATMRAQGVGPEAAMMGMRALLVKLAAPSKELTALTNRLGIDFSLAGVQAKGWVRWLAELQTALGGDSAALNEFIGQLGGKGAGGIIELVAAGTEKLAKNFYTVTKTTGLVNAQFEKMNETQAEQTEDLQAKFNRTLIELGQKILPGVVKVLERILELVDKLVEAFGGWDNVIEAISIAFAAWAGGKVFGSATDLLTALKSLKGGAGAGALSFLTKILPGGAAAGILGSMFLRGDTEDQAELEKLRMQDPAYAAKIAVMRQNEAAKGKKGRGGAWGSRLAEAAGRYGYQYMASVRADLAQRKALVDSLIRSEASRLAMEIGTKGKLGGFSMRQLVGPKGGEAITQITANLNLDMTGKGVDPADAERVKALVVEGVRDALTGMLVQAQAGVTAQ